MNSNSNIEKQAREWSITLSSGDVDKATVNEFNTWRSNNPAHEQAFQKVDRVWHGISTLEELRQYAKLPDPVNQKHSRIGFGKKLSHWLSELIQQPYTLSASGAFIVMISVGIFWLQGMQTPTAPNITEHHHTTAHGQVKDFTLEDGSQVTLAPESDIIVRFEQNKRNVLLLKGQGLFSVTKNADRPFTVLTDNTETRVLGTVFSVKRTNQQVSVAVKEGKVQVSKQYNNDTKRLLLPGQGLVASLKGDIGEVDTIDMDTIGSWVNGRLSYQDTSLKEIIADANQYYKGRIILGSTETGELRLAISFSTDNIDSMISNLAQLLPITVDKNRPETVILTKK